MGGTPAMSPNAALLARFSSEAGSEAAAPTTPADPGAAGGLQLHLRLEPSLGSAAALLAAAALGAVACAAAMRAAARG